MLCANIMIVDGCKYAKNQANSGENKEKLQKMHFSTSFFTIPNLIKKLKHVRN